MKSISRRKLLKQTVVGIGALSLGPVLAGCAPQATPTPPTALPPATLIPPGDTAVPLPTQAATLAPTQNVKLAEPSQPAATHPPAAKTTPTISSVSPTSAALPDMAVAHGPDPEAVVRQAIKAMGGMEQFIKKGAKVIVKPNICVAYTTIESAYTTNPYVVGALVKLCLEAGAASVRVMDFPFGGTAAEAYAHSGIGDEVKKAGGEMVQMAGYKFVPTRLVQGKDLKNIGIYDDILKADAIINVPIPKHHSLAGLTLAMKNLLGVIDQRENIHVNFAQRLPDLATQIKPVLNVVDAIRILIKNGPASGTKADVLKLDTIIVTRDIVAADAYAATLFGKKPEDLKNVVNGAAMKLGRMDLENLKIEEFTVGA